MNLFAGFSPRDDVWLESAHSGIPISDLAIGDNGQRKCVQDRGIRRRISGRFDGVRGSASETFVELNLDQVVTRPVKERVGEALAGMVVKKRRRQPKRFEAVDCPAYLGSISGPPDVIGTGIGAGVVNKKVLMLLFFPLHIPPMSCRHAAENHSRLDYVETGRETDPVEKGLPYSPRFFGAQSVRDHRDAEHIVAADARHPAPMVVQKIVVVKIDEVAQELAKCVIGGSPQTEDRAAPKFGKLVHPQSQFGHDTEGAPAASFEGPK